MIKKITVSDLFNLNELTKEFNINVNSTDLENETNYYIGYIQDEKLVAFINYSIYYERAEINYIFVLEEYRRKNIASQLLQYISKTHNYLENITLEVRESNICAIKLYEKNGFKKCAIRKRYYGDENAILMIKNFGDINE